MGTKTRIRLPNHGGGWTVVASALRLARTAGPLRLLRAMRSGNACKTCALGMGGQQGGMRNEAGHFPEFCSKSLQAMASDMQGAISERFFETHSLAELQGFSPRDLERCGRLAFPIVAAPGDSHFRRLEWDDALARVAAHIRRTPPEQSFFYFSGRSSNEAGFLLQLFARVYGTNHVNNCSYYCHQASGVGLSESLGTGTSTVALSDLEQTRLVFLIGANPASNHPRLMSSLARLRRRGGHIVVINPLREAGLVRFKVPSDPASMLAGSDIASLYLQPHIGGDIAVLAGIAKHLIALNALDRAFIAAHTEDFEAFEALVGSLSWEAVEHAGGVPRAALLAAARLYAEAPSAIFAWAMGVTHHVHGVENVQWIVNLVLMRGMVGKAASGVMPIRGHSNVQGLGTVGVTPGIRQAAFQRLQELGVCPPAFAGYDTMACVQAARRGEMCFAFCLGGNLFGSNPDARPTHEALGRIDQMVYLNTTLNTTHTWGRGKETLIFPVRARDEERQPTTQESMFNFVRLSDGGPARVDGVMSEVEIIGRVAEQVVAPGVVDFRTLTDHSQIRRLIAQLVPSLEGLAEIDRTRQEFHISGRVLHEPRFATPAGKARFRAHGLPVVPRDAGTLRLMTIRSEGQFNTVVYDSRDAYRGQERRDVILLNRADMERLGLVENQRVTVSSACGGLSNILVRTFEIREGNAAMYYPEANVLVPPELDARSRTPAFKNVAIWVKAQHDGACGA